MTLDVEERRFQMTLAYDGTDYHGWQVQPGVQTVAGSLAGAIESTCGARPHLAAAGRTDAGVHAHGQVAVATVPCPVDPTQLWRGCQRNLPPDIRILDAAPAPDGFDPRRDAWRRSYRYLLVAGSWLPPGLGRYAWGVDPRLELSPMREGAATLLGAHDFGAFGTSPEPGGTTRRLVDLLEVRRRSGLIEIEVRADAFLRGMLRSMVGALVGLGLRRLGQGELREAVALGAGARRRWAPAPARGLHQWRVEYHRPSMLGVRA